MTDRAHSAPERITEDFEEEVRSSTDNGANETVDVESGCHAGADKLNEAAKKAGKDHFAGPLR